MSFWFDLKTLLNYEKSDKQYVKIHALRWSNTSILLNGIICEPLRVWGSFGYTMSMCYNLIAYGCDITEKKEEYARCTSLHVVRA